MSWNRAWCPDWSSKAIPWTVGRQCWKRNSRKPLSRAYGMGGQASARLSISQRPQPAGPTSRRRRKAVAPVRREPHPQLHAVPVPEDVQVLDLGRRGNNPSVTLNPRARSVRSAGVANTTASVVPLYARVTGVSSASVRAASRPPWSRQSAPTIACGKFVCHLDCEPCDASFLNGATPQWRKGS